MPQGRRARICAGTSWFPHRVLCSTCSIGGYVKTHAVSGYSSAYTPETTFELCACLSLTSTPFCLFGSFFCVHRAVCVEAGVTTVMLQIALLLKPINTSPNWGRCCFPEFFHFVCIPVRPSGAVPPAVPVCWEPRETLPQM